MDKFGFRRKNGEQLSSPFAEILWQYWHVI